MSIGPSDAVSGMECGDLERTLDTYLDEELDERERAEADAHVAQCGRCRSLVDSRARIRSHIRARLRTAMGPGAPAGCAPRELRERIVGALARERRPLWRRVFGPIPAATVAACAAGAMVVLATHRGPDPMIEEAVRKHTRDLPLEMIAAEANPEAMVQTLAAKLEFNVRPPSFRGAGVRLVGARLTHLREKPAAYVRYDVPRGHLGLFIVDDPDGRVGETGRAMQVGPATVRMINSRGYNVAVWRHNEIVYSLVSDLDEGDLVRLLELAGSER